MTGSRHVTKNSTTGDAAVDGLFGGVMAGMAMAVYLVLVGLAAGEGLGTMLSRFALDEGTAPLVGALNHLAVAGIYGVLFGVVWRLTARIRPGWLPAGLGGLAYGLILLLLARVIILPGAASPLLEVSAIHFTLAHLIYGLTLGFLISRGDVHHERVRRRRLK